MADGLPSLDDIIAETGGSPISVMTPVSTPMAMPSPTATPMAVMTPVAAATPSQGYLSSLGQGVVGGVEDVASGYSALLDLATNKKTYTGLYDALTSPGQTAQKIAPYVTLENALKVGRAIPRIAYTGAGSYIGGLAGATIGGAGGTAVGGAPGGVVGTYGGGLLGLGAGFALANQKYNEFENKMVSDTNLIRSWFGLPAYELPHKTLTGPQQVEQFTRETTGAALGEVPARALMGLPSVAKIVAGKAGKIPAEIKSEALPISSPVRREAQKEVVADVFSQAGVTKEMLDQVVERKRNPVTPFDSTKKTSELLDDLGYKEQAKKLATIEAYAAESPAGQLPALAGQEARAASQEAQIAALMESPDPDKRALGQKLEGEFKAVKEAAKQEYEDLYTKLYETSDKTKLTATQLPEQLRAAASKYLPEGYASDKNVIDKVVNVLEKKKSYDIRDLVGASSRLKEEARDLYAKKTSVDARLAGAAEDASKVIDALIENDPRFGQHFAKANQARADFASKYQQGRVAQVGREFDISPENIAAELSQNTNQWVQGMKVFGDNPEATRALITQKLDGFANLGSLDEKIKWLDSNIDLFKSTDQIGAVRQAREGLVAAKKYIEQQKRLGKSVESLTLDGIGIGDLQRTAITAATAELPESGKAALQGLRQATRDKSRQATAGMTRLVSGLSTPWVAPVASKFAQLFLGRSVKNVERAVTQINQTLVSALNNPARASRLMQYAGRRAENLAKAKQKYGGMAARGKAGLKEALGVEGTTATMRGSVTEPILEALRGNTPQKTSSEFGTNTSALAPAVTPSPTPTPAATETPEPLSLDDIIAATGASSPTPTKEPGVLEKVAKALNPITEAEAESRKPSKMPVLKTIAQKQAYLKQKAANFDIKKEIKLYSKMVQAVAQVESGTDHGKVSEAGAVGAMQIMPETAKALGIDPYDPRQNLDGGEKYLDYLYKRFGKAPLAFAAYNMGEGKLSRMIKQAGSTNWSTIIRKVGIKSKRNPGGVPEETLAYVPKVMKNYLG